MYKEYDEKELKRLKLKEAKLERIEKELDKMGYSELSYQVMQEWKKVCNEICELMGV